MADNSNRLAGTAYLSVDGASYMLAGKFSYRPSTVTRETLSGMDGVHGYKESPTPGQIKATLRDAGGLTVSNFNAMTNSTVTVEMANGKVVTGGGMWTTDAQEVDGEEGTFDVVWEGRTVQEV